MSDWFLTDNSAEDFVIARQGGVSVLTLAQSSGVATFADNVILDSASPQVKVGDATGSPLVILNKDTTAASRLIFQNESVQNWQIQNNSSEDLVLARASEVAVLTLSQSDGLATFANAVEVGGDVGFYGTTPVTQPTVTGSRGGNAALASLLTALEGMGLIVDSST